MSPEPMPNVISKVVGVYRDNITKHLPLNKTYNNIPFFFALKEEIDKVSFKKTKTKNTKYNILCCFFDFFLKKTIETTNSRSKLFKLKASFHFSHSQNQWFREKLADLKK